MALTSHGPHFVARYIALRRDTRFEQPQGPTRIGNKNGRDQLANPRAVEQEFNIQRIHHDCKRNRIPGSIGRTEDSLRDAIHLSTVERVAAYKVQNYRAELE